MAIEQTLRTRSSDSCELCAAKAATSKLSVYDVQPNSGADADTSVLLCGTCMPQITGTVAIDSNHWRCLNESMWSEHPAVQVLAYRVLKQLQTVGWAQDLLGQLYIDDEKQAWADAGTVGPQSEDDDEPPTMDSNGTRLEAGDTVTLIKDLDVKGANFTAKRGTIVKNISLTGDPKFVEGKVNGTVIVLVAAYLKKA